MTKSELKELINEVISETMNEVGGYEDGIKDAKDRMKYVALRKMEKDHLTKSKLSKDIKKQHHLNMADKYLKQALDIAKKHGVIDEADDKAKAINRGVNRGLIVQQPTSSLEGAVAKNVENHGHYHADMTLVAKDGREVKGRFEFDSPGAISRGF